MEGGGGGGGGGGGREGEGIEVCVVHGPKKLLIPQCSSSQEI